MVLPPERWAWLALAAARWIPAAEPLESVQKQIQRELELELIIAALADDGRLVVIDRPDHLGDMRIPVFHLADHHRLGCWVEARRVVEHVLAEPVQTASHGVQGMVGEV